MKDISCCFTGHRVIPKEEYEAVKERMWQAITDLVEHGYSRFITGGALGFDTLAAKAILYAKKTFPHLHLTLAIPCPDQAKYWRGEDVSVYNSIKECADEVVLISPKYDGGCMHRRNRFMVEQSSVCIAYLKESRGGTAYTVARAKDLGLKVINVAEDDVRTITLNTEIFK